MCWAVDVQRCPDRGAIVDTRAALLPRRFASRRGRDLDRLNLYQIMRDRAGSQKETNVSDAFAGLWFPPTARAVHFPQVWHARNARKGVVSG
jgi:hypothetical protein